MTNNTMTKGYQRNNDITYGHVTSGHVTSVGVISGDFTSGNTPFPNYDDLQVLKTVNAAAAKIGFFIITLGYKTAAAALGYMAAATAALGYMAAAAAAAALTVLRTCRPS
jgi:hypothetical protein